MNKKKYLTLKTRKLVVGWLFIIPAVLLLCIFSFYPMFQDILLSLKTGPVNQYRWTGFSNYFRILKDKNFLQTLRNTFIYLLLEVPVMLLLSMLLAAMLNNKHLRFKGIFRTLIFLPCATANVCYSMIFRSMFATSGFVNSFLGVLGLPAVNWFGQSGTARFVLIVAMIWKSAGYYMVFFLAGMQNIPYEVYESARTDGANSLQIFLRITIPLLRPTILLTGIMSVNGALQMFDESMNLTKGGPGISTMTMSHYIYNLTFIKNPNFTYAASLSILILVMVAVLALVQLKVGDKRD